MKNKLNLKKETLAELTSDELRVINGGVDSGSCTSCICSCYAVSCLLWTVTDGVTSPATHTGATADFAVNFGCN
jgi:hypothetical protein